MCRDQIEGSRSLISSLPLKQEIGEEWLSNLSQKIDEIITCLMNTNLQEWCEEREVTLLTREISPF
jgi:hypothetical protein